MSPPAAIHVEGMSHRYGERTAVRDLQLSIDRGELVAVLGPNGSGKSTLFRVLSTLVPLQAGRIEIFGYDIVRQAAEIRRTIGVVFQSPSLDKKLSVAENIACHGRLFGLSRSEINDRMASLLDQLGISDRRDDLVESLSGGLRRRVELAKALLSRPQLLLLDEPSTGLDPSARIDLWTYLRRIRDDHGTTVVLTTHLLDEAERADRVAIMDQGEMVAIESPQSLRNRVVGHAVTIEAVDPKKLIEEIGSQFGIKSNLVDHAVRLEVDDGREWVAKLLDAFPAAIQSISIGKPTLEDVFIDLTGHRFSTQPANDDSQEAATA